MDFRNGQWTTTSITDGQGCQMTDYSTTAGTDMATSTEMRMGTRCSTCMTTGGIPAETACPTCAGIDTATETVGIPVKTTCPTCMTTTGMDGMSTETMCKCTEMTTRMSTETGTTTEKGTTTIAGMTDYGTCTCQDVKNEKSASKNESFCHCSTSIPNSMYMTT